MKFEFYVSSGGRSNFGLFYFMGVMSWADFRGPNKGINKNLTSHYQYFCNYQQFNFVSN